MSNKREKWNPPSWPWELELIILFFFLVALLVPYYFHGRAPADVTPLTQTTNDALAIGQQALSTQFGFLWAVGITALYVIHIVFSMIEVNRMTASPMHLLAPCVFAFIAYYRIDSIPNLQNTQFSMIDGSAGQVLALVAIVALVTSILARLRTYRYLLNFDDVTWDITSPARYDATYLTLIMEVRPLLYAPRRYRACSEGILVEGWFYAMPIGFNDVHAVSVLNTTTVASSGFYYASSTHNLIRLELHDSLKATYISPDQRDDFARYCLQHITRRHPAHKATKTRHGMLHASDTHAAAYASDTHPPANGDKH